MRLASAARTLGTLTPCGRLAAWYHVHEACIGPSPRVHGPYMTFAKRLQAPRNPCIRAKLNRSPRYDSCRQRSVITGESPRTYGGSALALIVSPMFAGFRWDFRRKSVEAGCRTRRKSVGPPTRTESGQDARAKRGLAAVPTAAPGSTALRARTSDGLRYRWRERFDPAQTYRWQIDLAPAHTVHTV